jgi:D-psicose/D-tagatose/L-ribulose 3-epimerase
MRFGIHCFLFVTHWSDKALAQLDRARALGCECFEIAVGDDAQFETRATRERAEKMGLELIVSPGGAWPAAADLSAEAPATRSFAQDWHRKQVTLAAELGASAYCGALYGHPGTVLRRRPPRDEFARTADALHALAEYGAQQGVAIVLEPMSHFRTHLVNTPRQALELITQADHPNLHVLFDTYHAVTELRDFRAALLELGPRLWAVHACENDRGVPGGGLVPWPEVFAALYELGFDGRILLESYYSALGDFAFERGMFHNVCPDPEAFIRQGFAFLQSGLRRPVRA